jgi:hypothetical protein
VGGFNMNPETSGAAICALVVLIAAVFAIRHYRRSRPSAEELERRRRAMIHRLGKTLDGEIIDVDPSSAFIAYSYSVAGVEYTATQDASGLRSSLPPDVMSVIGPVSVKFDPRNPANSIVLCEDWTGLRNRA